jgi:signal transduction histidine kinase
LVVVDIFPVFSFFCDLSHELNNPVAAIRASAEVLEEGALEEPQDARLFVGRIREAAGRIERLLGELLSLARIEARGVERFDSQELSQLAARAIKQCHDGERVTLEVTGDTRVQGDEQWLSRAIVNLVDNALLHSNADSPVGVTVHGTAEGVRVTVKNPGEVVEHVRKQLFRRFVSTRIDKGGSGLGLAIVRAVAEAHLGSVELIQGGPPEVEFALSLPLAAGRARAHLDKA